MNDASILNSIMSKTNRINVKNNVNFIAATNFNQEKQQTSPLDTNNSMPKSCYTKLNVEILLKTHLLISLSEMKNSKIALIY